MAKTISKNIRDLIVAQALREIAFARNYKQGKARNWKTNEDLYYGRKLSPEASRSNVDLGQMQSYVHTILSKVDNPLIFKYVKRKEAQLMRVNRLNALRVYDQSRDDWDMKDLVGKKQAIIYGRAIYSYFADSHEGYCPHLDNVDVYDFLIDPSAGGLDIERANFLGDYGVVLTRSQLEAGVKEKRYLKDETKTLLAGSGNATDVNQEETNKINRTRDQNVWQVNKEISNPDKFKFWRWGTTYEGQRYYLLLNFRGGTAIVVDPIEEHFESGLWWYWTYAAFPDLTEFWTPSWCDYVRDPIMAKNVTINQSIDMSEQIIKPQRVVNVGAISNLAELKYRREGYIKVNKDFDIQKAVQFMPTTSIDTPIKVFQILDTIQSKASGVTDGDQGGAVNGADSKVAIYEGNQANSADRFGYFNKSYSHGYKRFALLYKNGVKEHLLKKVAIDIMGPDGIDLVELSRKDIFWKNEDFGLIVESSNAELDMSTQDKKQKLVFLSEQSKITGAPQNPKKAYEMQATILGFKEEEIRELMDTSEFGDAALMSQAERDIELVLDGQKVPPNPGATTAYKQRFVDYMTKHQYDLSDMQFSDLTKYVESIGPIIIRNTVKMANAAASMEMLKNATAGISDNEDGPGEPTQPQTGLPVAPAVGGGGATLPV